jgi:hypothetical protein
LDEFELVAGDIKDGWTVLCGFVYCGVKRFFGMEEVCGEEGHLEVVLRRRGEGNLGIEKSDLQYQYHYDASISRLQR